MKIAVKVHDVVALAKRFELAPAEAWREVVEHMRESVVATLEQVMNDEMELFLGQQPKGANKRNGFTTRTYAVKGLGAVAKQAHPTHEHYLPLLYAAGAVQPTEMPRFFNTGYQSASISMRSVLWG